jgi:hypothetical protein
MRDGDNATSATQQAEAVQDVRISQGWDGAHAVFQTAIPDRDGLYLHLRITVNTEQEAQLTVEDCERDDFMLQTARSLVNAAVEAHMRLHHIDCQVAHDWIRKAAD